MVRRLARRRNGCRASSCPHNNRASQQVSICPFPMRDEEMVPPSLALSLPSTAQIRCRSLSRAQCELMAAAERVACDWSAVQRSSGLPIRAAQSHPASLCVIVITLCSALQRCRLCPRPARATRDDARCPSTQVDTATGCSHLVWATDTVSPLTKDAASSRGTTPRAPDRGRDRSQSLSLLTDVATAHMSHVALAPLPVCQTLRRLQWERWSSRRLTTEATTRN
jgi:hypothetical protein